MAAYFADHDENIIDIGTDRFVRIVLPTGFEVVVWRNGIVTGNGGRHDFRSDQ